MSKSFSRCLLITPGMSGKCEAEIISLKQGNWNPLLVENVLGSDACIDHLPLKWGIDDGCTCVTFSWDSDVQKTVLNKNKIAVEMIARIVENVPRIEPLTDCKYGNVVVCFTDRGSGVHEETGGWCNDMPEGPDTMDFVVGGIRKGIRKEWFANDN